MDARLDLTTLEHFGSGLDPAQRARLGAGKIFEKALARGRRRRLLGRLFGRSREMRLMGRGQVLRKQGGTGIRLVRLAEIVGSEARSLDFDREFLPLKSHLEDRWVGIAAARNRGIPLPPVELVQTKSGYFIRDGHHRISVARMLGQREIEARIMN